MPSNEEPSQARPRHRLPTMAATASRTEIPIKVRILGNPSAADLEQLTDSVARAVGKQLRAAGARKGKDLAGNGFGQQKPPSSPPWLPPPDDAVDAFDGLRPNLGRADIVRQAAQRDLEAEKALRIEQQRRGDIKAASDAALSAVDDNIAHIPAPIAEQLRAIKRADPDKPLPEHLNIGLAHILHRMVNKARERKRVKPSLQTDFSIMQLSASKGGHKGGRSIDIDRYAGLRIDFRHGAEAVRAVAQFYADMLDIPLPGQTPADVDVDTQRLPVDARLSLLVPRNPRTSGLGAREDARESAKEAARNPHKPYMYRGDPDGTRPPILRDECHFPDFFFPRATPPRVPPGGGHIEVNITRLVRTSQLVFARLHAQDHARIVHLMMSDALDHLHVQSPP